MINTTELRRGNYILLDGKHFGKVIAICVMGNDVSTQNPHNQYTNGTSGDLWKADSDYIGPIPLTQDILEACGFNRILNQGFSNLYSYEKFEVDVDTELNMAIFMLGKYIVHIYYLHHLQNLYYFLSGSELQVNLKDKV